MGLGITGLGTYKSVPTVAFFLDAQPDSCVVCPTIGHYMTTILFIVCTNIFVYNISQQ